MFGSEQRSSGSEVIANATGACKIVIVLDVLLGMVCQTISPEERTATFNGHANN